VRLQNKVAVVTGSTKGIGRAIAEGFAGEGAKVIVTGRDQGGGAEVRNAIRAAGGEATFVSADVSSEDEVRSLVARSVETYGGIDILVNNAAAVEFIGAGGDRPLADQTTEDFDQVLKVGLYGVFWACKYTIPAMIERGAGSIINISSIASQFGQPGVPSYTASKAALNGLTRQVAAQYAAAGIRSNAIVVGFVLSGTFAQAIEASPSLRQAIDDIGLVKQGAPDDIAHLATFLASDGSRFLTGMLVPADGGLSARSQMPDFSALLGSL
jgi:meso-butanediol dehydrogenase / (S,S)-butanediol dehydrogenase / diacetyl reductase